MSALRFLAGVCAGVSLAALVAGATLGAPTGAGPDVATPPPREEARPPAAGEANTAPASKKEPVERGVLARAAAAKQVKVPDAKGTATPAARRGAKRPKEAVIESVEVDWGAPTQRP